MTGQGDEAEIRRRLNIIVKIMLSVDMYWNVGTALDLPTSSLATSGRKHASN
jgi:hypothetical protein